MEQENFFEYEIIPGFRKSSKLMYVAKEEQIYRFTTTIKNVKYYYCYNKNCKIGVSVNVNNSKYCNKIGKVHEHIHGPQTKLYNKLKVMNNIKLEVQNAPLKRSSVREIFDNNCKKFKEASESLEYGIMRRQLFNIKQECFPKNPTNFEDIIQIFKNKNVYDKFGVSRYETDKSAFYIDTVITNEFSYSIFVSPTILKYLKSQTSSEPRTYILDGTFNVIPVSKQFKQLLIFHINHADHAYPFIYALMSNKSQNIYIHLLQYIKANILDLNPQTVVSDFETSLRNAVKTIYPSVNMVGCWFHFTNALRRKALKLPNFVKHLNANRRAKNLFQKFLYLPLLKPTDATKAYDILQGEVIDDFFKPFIKYFNLQWMKKVKPENFTVYKQSIRTSNSAEGFHSRLNITLPKHGNFYKFLDVLCGLDEIKSIDYSKSVSGSISIYRKKSSFYQNRDKFIADRLNLLKQNKISLGEILSQFANMDKCMIPKDFLNEIHSSDSDEASYDEDNSMDDESQNQILCILCCERERQLLFVPCKHFKVCQPCYQQMKSNAEQNNTKTLCPICRAIIVDAFPIYS